MIEMREETREVICAEVHGALEWLGDEYKEKLPEKVKNYIEEYRNKEYNYNYDKNIELADQDIGRKATALLCILHYKYWCKSQEEKEKIVNILKYNTRKKQEQFLDYEEMFEKKEEQEDERIESLKEEKSLKIVTTADKWYSKVWNFVSNIFKKR